MFITLITNDMAVVQLHLEYCVRF